MTNVKVKRTKACEYLALGKCNTLWMLYLCSVMSVSPSHLTKTAFGPYWMLVSHPLGVRKLRQGRNYPSGRYLIVLVYVPLPN